MARLLAQPYSSLLLGRIHGSASYDRYVANSAVKLGRKPSVWCQHGLGRRDSCGE